MQCPEKIILASNIHVMYQTFVDNLKSALLGALECFFQMHIIYKKSHLWGVREIVFCVITICIALLNIETQNYNFYDSQANFEF